MPQKKVNVEKYQPQSFGSLIMNNHPITKLKMFQNIFPLANSFAKWENVRRWEAPYGTRLGRIRTTLGHACMRH